MILLNITTFFSHLHPLVVHLPIGFLLLAVFFNILSYSKKYNGLKFAESLALLLGFISAIAACIFGYLLSLSGDYDQHLRRNHEFTGILIAIISGILYFSTTSDPKKASLFPNKTFSVILISLIVLVCYCGHMGASLTHGNDYLSIETLMMEVRDKPTNVANAMIFEDVVQPILQNKCAQCHREGKLKGNLSVGSLHSLYKGGKSGAAIVPGKLTESELYKRVTIDPENKDFMPKDGKPPLTKSEVAIIRWWIDQANATDGKKMSELKNSEAIKPQIMSYLGLAGGDLSVVTDTHEVAEAINSEIPVLGDTVQLEQLRKKGLMVRLMLKKPLMLDITLPAKSGIKITDFKENILPLAKNIIWLNLSANNLSDDDLSFIKLCTNLEKLRLENNPLTDQVVNNLYSMKHLKSVNLNGTKVTNAAIMKLKKNPSVKSIYAWRITTNQASN